MKRTLTTLILIVAMYGLSAQSTQPGTTKPVSNPTLSSSTSQSNNSNSGVNPNGNPGTIISTTTNSNAINSGLIQPVTPAPAYYSTTDTVPVRTTSTATPDSSLMATSEVVSGDSILQEPVLTDADAPIVVADTQNIVTSGVAPEGNIAGQNMALSAHASYGYDEATLIGLSRYAALPQLNTWVPETVVSSMTSRFGNSLYDITMVKAVAGEEKYSYIVRTQENGTFETHTVTDVN